MTPEKPDGVPTLGAEAVAEHLTAIREALDLEALKSAYRTAYSEAKRAAEAWLGSQASRYRERT